MQLGGRARLPVAAGAAFVNLLYLLRLMLEAIVAGEGEQPLLWPDARSLTVWTARTGSP